MRRWSERPSVRAGMRARWLGAGAPVLAGTG